MFPNIWMLRRWERIKRSLFGYEGWLPLSPGKYKVEFLLTNKLNQTAYKAERQIVVPSLSSMGVQVSEIVAFSNATEVGPGKNDLPFTLGGVRFTPITGEGLTFSPGQNLSVFYQYLCPSGYLLFFQWKKSGCRLCLWSAGGASGDSRSIHEEVAKQQFDSFGSLPTGKKIVSSRCLRRQLPAHGFGD